MGSVVVVADVDDDTAMLLCKVLVRLMVGVELRLLLMYRCWRL